MGARLSAALLAGRTAAVLSRRLGRGGGTVIAGHLVPRLAPDALRDITGLLPNGSIVVSGTNGKTTTTRLLSHILRGAGFRPIHNRAGANMLSGLFTAVAQGTDWRGRPRGDLGLFEVDEATIPATLAHVEPRVLLLHNIFRDQLDRYGEVHFVAVLWQTAVDSLGPRTTLALNADDPLVAALDTRAASGARVVTYGMADARVGERALPHAADARLCPRCAALHYSLVFYGHLGHYSCTRCDFARPTPTIAATTVELLGDDGANLTIETPDGVLRARTRLPGLYNVGNALAAATVCSALGVRRELIARGLETFTAAFGRVERIQVEDRQLFLTLVKNPVGFTEVLRTVLGPPGMRTLLLSINDHFADGTDVSWLWDVEFERLAERVNVAICSGTRAEDMAVRLKYAGVPTDRIKVENDPRRAIELALLAAEPRETVYVLPTYTAMLAIRDLLHRTGYVRGFWEDLKAMLRLVHLYPDLMSVYGDRGNVLTLVRRAEWRGYDVEVSELSVGDDLDPEQADLIFFGGGQDREQAVVSADFLEQKGQAVRQAVEGGAALLSVCGGYQLLGRSYTTVDGQELPGAGLFDVRSVPGPRRHIGNVLIETELDGATRTLVGFENHSGRTYLGGGVRPLGRTVVGAGNNGEDGTEGAVYRGAIGCYLHGSLLPKNPWLADRLLRAALSHRLGEPVRLGALDDRLELDAHRVLAARIRGAGGRVKSGAW